MPDLLSQTWSNLTANRLRSLLTMFGIAWGVMTIVILSAVGEGFQRGNQAVLRELGRNIVIIRNGRTSLQAGGERAGRMIRLTIQDVHTLRDKSALIDEISPELIRTAVRAKSDFNASSPQMSGVWPAYQTLRTLEVDRGRLLRAGDCEEARRVLLIGFEASRLLFADRDPIGRNVLLNGIPYTVVGRVRKKFQDSNYTGADDERLFAPYEAMRRDFPLPEAFATSDSLSTIIAGTAPPVVQDIRRLFEAGGNIASLGRAGGGPVEADVRRLLGPIKGFDPEDREALSMWNTVLESVMFERMIGAMNEFFLAVSFVTLGLGGIGVMNIMLISVRERTREIGIRKALGATSRSVQWQFFSEGLFLTLLSGAIGFSLGLALCAGINMLPLPERFSGMVTTWRTAAVAVATLAAIGVAAATYPARRAAALPPVDALRYEM
jgi:putative ABC transport system permease protein